MGTLVDTSILLRAFVREELRGRESIQTQMIPAGVQIIDGVIPIAVNRSLLWLFCFRFRVRILLVPDL